MAFRMRLPRYTFNMPDLVKMSPFAIIGTIASVQFVLSMRTTRIELKKRRRQKEVARTITKSLYWRIVNGECHRGWSMVVPRRLIEVTGNEILYGTVLQGLPDGGNDYTIMTVIGNWMPNSRRMMLTLRLYSLLCPEISSCTILRIVRRSEDWIVRRAYYLDEFTVGLLFQRGENTTRYRLVISHANRRGQARIFDLEAPIRRPIASLVYADRGKKRLFVAFSGFTWRNLDENADDEGFQDEEDSVFQSGIASYLLPDERQDTVVHYPLGYESIIVPRKRYTFVPCCCATRGELLMFMQNTQEETNTEPPLCLHFRVNGGWIVERLGLWVQRMRREKDTNEIRAWKHIKLLSSFRDIDPPRSRCRTRRLPLIGTCPAGVNWSGDSFFVTTGDGLFRRWTSPPSLKFVAAEAMFRKNPGLKKLSRSELKDTVGFDVLEGMPERPDVEEDVPHVYL